MKPTPLPPDPTFLDRVEHALQWSLLWMAVWIPGRPMLSGICSGLLMLIPLATWVIVLQILLSGALIHTLQQTGHWRP